jgi:acetylornithine deacetylase/succinyl-diaminopimelate desuccinylase-like protein
VRAYHQEHAHEILHELHSLLEIPNVASDIDNMRRNAEHLSGMLRARGLEPQLLEVEGGPPAVFASLTVPGARRTLVFYAHYDGQPVDPARWHSPPWTPVVRAGSLQAGAAEVKPEALRGPLDPEWRIYARSASDDKAPIVAMLRALDALRAAGRDPSVNLKFFFEGEEEAGSPHLEALLRRHAELLTADLWIFCDGPVHQSGKLQVVFGVRGVLGLEMTVFGPTRAVHSGHYGNWVPNPLALLVDCLASMRGADGKVRIRGFYDDVRPVSAVERRALGAMPAVETQLCADLGLAAAEIPGAKLPDRLLLPAMNLRGIRGGAVGDEAANAIPVDARASIDFRLVPDQKPARIRELVEAHLRRHGYAVADSTPDAATRSRQARIVRLEWESGYPAQRTPLDLPVARAVVQSVEEVAGGDVVRVPSLGGSLPLYTFHDVFGAPLVIVPIVNYDNNQHAADENLRLQNLWDGIEVYAHLMVRVGELW